MKNVTHLQQFAHKLSILYIESDSTLHASLNDYFSDRFKNVYHAESVDEGITKCKKYLPNIILTDLSFATNNAFDMITKLQEISDQKNYNIQIIVLSKKNDDFMLLESFDVGLVKLLQKPIDYTKLNQAFEKAISNIINSSQNIVSQKLLLDKLQKNDNITCINNYKGLYIHEIGKFLSFKENRLEIQLSKRQLIAVIYEKQLIIQIDNSKILTKLIRVNRINSTAILSTPSILQNDSRDPRNKRIEVDKSFKASINFKGKHYDVEALDISPLYLTVKTHELIQMQPNDQVELTVGFEIDGPSSFIHERKFTKAFATAKVQRIEHFGHFFKLTLELTIKKSGQSVFLRYLQQREIEIIKEFKTKLKV